eukprot:2455753-Heterocapsa_arctica.AAC.1
MRASDDVELLAVCVIVECRSVAGSQTAADRGIGNGTTYAQFGEFDADVDPADAMPQVQRRHGGLLGRRVGEADNPGPVGSRRSARLRSARVGNTASRLPQVMRVIWSAFEQAARQLLRNPRLVRLLMDALAVATTEMGESAAGRRQPRKSCRVDRSPPGEPRN